MKDLKLAASTGQLRVSKDIFSERPFEYLCLPDDFLEWAEENNLEIYSQYMTLDQNINKRQTENVDNANSNPIQAIPMDWRDLKTLTIKQFVGFKCAVPSDYADNPDSDPMLKMMIEAVTQSLVAGVFAGDIRTTEPYGLIVEQGSQGLEVTELSPCDYKYNIEHHSVIYTEDALNYINGVEDQQQTDSHPVATDSPQQLRLNDLKEYIGLLETQAAAKKIPFDALDLPLTKKRLLEELQARYNTFKRIKNDQFEKDWKIAKDEGICANQRATEAKGKTFLKSIYG